jgi:homoserine kinase
MDVLAVRGILAPRLHLQLHNEIPLGMGCGSSASALLAGILLANHFGNLNWTAQQILEEACRREGHPDNVAACYLGGMTVSSITKNGLVTATFGQDLNWSLLLALPSASLSTKKARALLPAHYSPRRRRREHPGHRSARRGFRAGTRRPPADCHARPSAPALPR